MRINERLDQESAGWWADRHKPEVMEKLVEHYRQFAMKIAQPLFKKIGHRAMTWDDTEAAAMLGLCEAIRRFTPGKHAAFTSFATWRVRGAIIDAARDNDWVPHSARAADKALEISQLPLMLPLDDERDYQPTTGDDAPLNLDHPAIPPRYHRPLENIIRYGIKKAAKLEFASVGQLEMALKRPLLKAMQ